MQTRQFFVDPDIRKAETLPGSFYRSAEVFEQLKEQVFTHTWHWVGDQSLVPFPLHVYPFVLLENYLEEPMVLTRNNEDAIQCLSNVCTHRGFKVVQNPGKQRRLICQYHGRRFSIDGQMEFMPEFKEALDFPRPCDHLHRFPLKQWGPFLFTALEPAFDFSSVLERMEERVGFLPLDQLKFDASRSKDYLVHAHWALYCDNYLEGFHIPFVHQGLNEVLDYGNYATEIYEYCNLQIGYSEAAVDVFDLPEEHLDYGKNVAGYYYWVFPNMMFNFYPWGLSVNIVQPIAIDRTRVSFLTYVLDPDKLDKGAGAELDKVEREDEFVVEGVFRGLQSRYYKSGRFSPKREQGVHHFHRLLAAFSQVTN